MLIISKNEKSIINFDNIKEIKIINNKKQNEFIKNTERLDDVVSMVESIIGSKITGDKAFAIYVYYADNNTTMLGDYDTEERCKEILTEIIDYYCTKKVYYMPEE